MPKMPRAILTTLSLMALGACGTPRVQIVKPPVALTSCADEPAAPDLPAVDWSSVEAARPVQQQRDRTVFDYIIAMRSAWGDCSAKVAGVKAWSDGLN